MYIGEEVGESKKYSRILLVISAGGGMINSFLNFFVIFWIFGTENTFGIE